MLDAKPAVYQRREPEKTVLYEVIRQHYQTFRAEAEASGRGLPAFIEREFEKFLACGILARGFCRVRCPECGYDRLVALSCKCRGICPSCIGRRMADTAAYLTDHVIPNVPMRTWTLTLPHPLRYLVAYNAEVLGEVCAAFSTSVLSWLRHTAKRELALGSVNQAYPGLITWVQRFGSGANLHPHLHGIATEGVFVETEGGGIKWHTLPEPTSADVAQIAWEVCRRVSRALQRRGVSLVGEAGDIDELAVREPLLAACYAASIQGFIATGRRAGQRMIQMGVANADHGDDRATGPAHGFNLFAGKAIAARAREKREHAIRYMARPPITDKRLSLTAEGEVILELKTPWTNGTTHLRFTGPEFIERLVALVPPPRVNLVRYAGIFAPHARLRPQVVELARSDSGVEESSACAHAATGRYLNWTELMRRIWELDVTKCPKCGQKGMQQIACITQGDVIRKILKSVGEPTAPPRFEPPRQSELEFGSAA